MKFNDALVNREERYALGTEEESGKHYVTFPVSNGLIEYEEYYAIDDDMFRRFLADPVSALAFVTRCRSRQEDDRLMIKPGRLRGSPT